jgi:uncharacterized protein DUF2393
VDSQPKIDPQIDSEINFAPRIEPGSESGERNWLPLAIAAGVVVLLAAAVILMLERGHKPVAVTPVSASPDPYAASLPISGLVMSESSNLAGGKVTYVDGHIRNTGTRTVSALTVQVLFRDPAKEVTQNETQPLKLIRTRDPYVDLEPVSAAPLQPGDQRDFRLIFDAVSPDWDGAYPEIRILHVESK